MKAIRGMISAPISRISIRAVSLMHLQKVISNKKKKDLSSQARLVDKHKVIK